MWTECELHIGRCCLLLNVHINAWKLERVEQCWVFVIYRMLRGDEETRLWNPILINTPWIQEHFIFIYFITKPPLLMWWKHSICYRLSSDEITRIVLKKQFLCSKFHWKDQCCGPWRELLCHCFQINSVKNKTNGEKTWFFSYVLVFFSDVLMYADLSH